MVRLCLLLPLIFSANTQGADGCQPPAFPPEGSIDGGAFLSNNQYIIPTMNFSGCGVVRNWTVVATGGGGNDNQDRIIELQLFRPDSAQSTVFTKVTSSAVTTRVDYQIATHTFTRIDFTFSPGDVLGFYYPSNVAFLEVHHTNSFSTHFILSSASSPATSTVTINSTTAGVPLMSVSVSCMGCPTSVATTSTAISSSTQLSSPKLLTSSLMESLARSMGTTNSTALNTVIVSSDAATVPSNTASVSSDAATVPSNTASVSSNTATVSSSIAVTTVSSSTVAASSGVTQVLTTLAVPSSGVPVAAVAGGAVGGVLIVLLIALILLIVIISSIVCFRRKRSKYALKGLYEYSSPDTVNFVDSSGTLDSVASITHNSTLQMDMSAPNYCEITDEVDHKPCTVASETYQNTAAFKQDGDECKKRSEVGVMDGHEYSVLDEVEEKKLPLPLPAREVTSTSENLYDTVPTKEERLRRQQRPATKYSENMYESASVRVETSTSWKSSAEQDIPEAIYEMSFCKEELYCEPSTDEEGIYAQMAKWGFRELPRSRIVLSKKLGEGEFGEVYKAEMKTVKGASLEVAVKLVKKGSPPEERTKLLQEAATLGQFKHRHVVRLIGVVTTGDPKMMLVELLPGGDLKAHLEKLSEDPSELSSPDLPSLLLQFCKQVVDGLACLAHKSFVHRDIAARNILLDKELNCKISDFGMTRDLVEDTYYTIKKGTKIPARWTAPEALMYKKYSTSSDVWSYGMLMYEIWSVGHKPFEDKTIQEVVKCMRSHYCLPPPPGCPRAVYEVMVKCWNPSHNERPSAADIRGEFCKSERILLSWKKEDIVSPSAQVLGGPLSDGEGLYKDLQVLYQTS